MDIFAYYIWEESLPMSQDFPLSLSDIVKWCHINNDIFFEGRDVFTY
jgi:hypothetical protein